MTPKKQTKSMADLKSASPSSPSKRLKLDSPTPKKEDTLVQEETPPETQTTATETASEWPGWCTVESEPAVFNELMKEIGVSGAQVEEVYALDTNSLRAMSPAHGMIFLFRWKPETVDNIETTCPENVWFANQVIDNACASLALLNIVFNSDVKLSPELQSFKEFSQSLTPPLKGLAVANYEHIRNIHNSFARKSEMIDVDINLADVANKKPRNTGSGDGEDSEDEVFHFIAYIHVGDTLYELDGLKKQPVRLRTCPKDDWLIHVGPTVQERISRYAEGELLFNLLAIVPERSPPDESFLNIAKKRKVDYEAFAHRAATILGKNSIARVYLSDD
ncbi:cysteine proteinase [Wilcoxina mikolae CBS 423.85]|nr:cysteine proteinase [Wilcoxina mikolae CBS 423.85]